MTGRDEALPGDTPALRRSPGRRSFLQLLATAAGGALLAPVFETRAAALPSLHARRLAWAGIQLQAGSSTLFLDPLTNPAVWEHALPDRLVEPEAPAGNRFVAVTHRHPDHFDPALVRRLLGDDGTLLCSPEVAPAAAARGIRTRTSHLYEPVLLGEDFTLTAVPASDGYGDPQVSWVVSGGGRRIIHCGDTLWHGGFWHVARQLGPFDAAFLPINGARFAWREPASGVPDVMTPEQAVAAAVVLGARLLVPIHYGVRGAEGYAEQPEPEAALLQAAKRRGVPVEVVQPGEWLSWTASVHPRNPR